MQKPDINIEQYVKKFPEHIAKLTNTVRALVKHTVPDCIERVYPGWKLIGYRAIIESKSHYFGFIFPTDDKVVLGFEYGTMLSDPNGVLEGTGTQVRYVTIRAQNDIKKSILIPLISEAVSIAVERKPQNRRKTKR